MNIRLIALHVVSVAALTPALANASPEKISAASCARAFATSMAAPGAGVPDYKLSYRPGQYSSLLVEFYQHELTFDLVAQDAKTGAPIARARCTTDHHGVVTALSPVSTGAL